MDSKDPFKDISFDGRPGNYREFRRKVILSVAALEDKVQHLAGPKLLSRLTGEAWRCTEHLSIAELRSNNGWLRVLECLDRNYKHLPEVELHESIDEFLFHLKRKPHEGATAFASRFKTALARLENLISAEREASHAKRRRKDEPGRRHLGPASPVASSLEDSSAPEADEEAEQTDAEEVPPAASGSNPAPKAEAAPPSMPAGSPPATEPFGSPRRSPPAGSQASQGSKTSHGSKKRTSGTFKADMEKQQLEMQRMLGTLEPGYRKPKPIFPQSVLGHLFMRKFGLNREQRSQVIRSTGGSSRFLDVERILRASDIEDNHRLEDRRGTKPPFKPARRETFAVQDAVDDSSSIDLPDTGSDVDQGDVLVGQTSDQSSEVSAEDEIEEIMEIQKKAKRDFKKSFRTYKETKKRVKEIKKSRMGNAPYYPVVAVPPDSNNSGASGSQPQQPKTFKYDRKDFNRKKGDSSKGGKPNPKREEAQLAESSVAAQFQYMVTCVDGSQVSGDVYLASIPTGMAILDTGCTTSVVGSDTVARYTKHFQACGYPSPVPIVLPPVELKGFNGQTETTTSGLKWTVKLGELHGTVTTYVIAGATPFLLSRRVLEGMGAVLDLGSMTITSEKHQMFNQRLPQASNGHLLLPLCPPANELEIAQCDEKEIENEPNCANPPQGATDQWSTSATCATSQKDCLPVPETKSNTIKRNPKNTVLDKRRAFQTVVKNTKNGVVDMNVYRNELAKIFGEKADNLFYAAVAYQPKKERIPVEAGTQSFEVSVAEMSKSGDFTVHPWRTRSASNDRCTVSPMSVAIFAFRLPEPLHNTPAGVASEQPTCFCCNENDAETTQNHSSTIGMETLYEETDWVDLEGQQPLPEHVHEQLSKSIASLRKASCRLTLSRIATDPAGVKAELQAWLKEQAPKLDQRVGLVEVFTGQANLSKTFEDRSNATSIRLGLEYGQDFTRLHDRRCMLLLIAFVRPSHVWFSFPCKLWGAWTNMNLNKDPKTRDEILRQRTIARKYLHNVSEAWHLQKHLGGHAHCENPLSSQAWAELRLGECWEVRIDQCALGLRSPRSDVPILKPTRIVTTQESLAAGIASCRCDGRHRHEHLEGSYKGKNLTSWAENYPRKFCRTMVKYMLSEVKEKFPSKHVEEILAQEEDQVDQPQHELEGVPEVSLEKNRATALIRKLHVNTGHSSKEQMLRLAFRCQSSPAIVQAIRDFKCSVCDELKRPSTHRRAAIQHADKPNQIVAVDFVQIELKREDRSGKVQETVRNALTCVDLATDFCQQIVVPADMSLSEAFHKVWGRPYGVPKTIYMDPDHRTISIDFQRYLVRHDVQLLHSAAEAHWQLGKVEVCNRILRGMAQHVWLAGSTASPEETIEMCATIRNEQLRKHGFSPVQWFLGREPTHAGSLADVDQQRNPATQSQVLDDETFAANLRLRDLAARAFIAEHAKDTWRRAVAGRSRPMRGPFIQGQQVYMFRRRARGLLSTRHGVWLGPGRIIGTESASDGPIPRIIWVSFNGMIYRCAPESLRPMAEDEAHFRQLSKDLAVGSLPDDVERAEEKLHGRFGNYVDLTKDLPEDMDLELDEDVQAEPEHPKPHLEGGPQKIRRRFYRSPEYWEARAAGAPPLGALHEGPMPNLVSLDDLFSQPNQDEDIQETPMKRPRVRIDSAAEEIEAERAPSQEYSPSIGPADEPSMESQAPLPEASEPASLSGDVSASAAPDSMLDDTQSSNQPSAETTDAAMNDQAIHVPVPDDDELHVSSKTPSKHAEQVFEMSLDILPEDISDNPLCLWGVLDECFQVTPKAKLRKVEVSFRKLSQGDQQLFEKAMQKEWNSWIENKVTSLCKSKGIPTEKVIKARWVLTWKKSSDPDDKNKTPKARLVLVGWQDPELGKIQTDSPTLRKETKHMILSLCAARRWKLWGADIKTAFLSGDPSSRDIFFKPPKEIKQWMNLSEDDLFRLEKAAYGLAEAPRAWFLRLSRELKAAGLSMSQLDPCLYCLRKGSKLIGVCGVHVDDLIGGGEPEMDQVLANLKKKLPFGDYRTYTIRYTGIEIRQCPNTYAIEVGQESYIDALEPVPTKPLGTSSTPLNDASIMRTCAGQLAWVATSTRPDQSFLASYLQGVQEKGTVADVQMYNKALREMKERKVCLRFPSGVSPSDWRILCISDAGWATRANGESQGGYLLCLTTKAMFERRRTICWIIDWQSKKLRRVVRSSVAAETLASQNGLDGIEAFQALLAETLHGISPRDFRNQIPKDPAGLVVDSKGFFDAVTRSCCSQAISLEKRLQIDYAIAKETTTNQNIMVYWVNNLRMSADCLTKLKGDTKPLYEILDGGSYEITICLQSGKKEKQGEIEQLNKPGSSSDP